MSTDAATDYGLVRDLVQAGMDCMRINCAHDTPEAWLEMIRNLERARQETGRKCRILMDVAGPKLRTGAIQPGPAVITCRPTRDVYGHVVAPARIWLTSEVDPEAPTGPASACVPISGNFVQSLRPGDSLSLRDARKANRTLHITQRKDRSCWPRRVRRSTSRPASSFSRFRAQTLPRRWGPRASASCRRWRRRCC